MTASELPQLRLLANNGCITYTEHAIDQMLEREISQHAVKQILTSQTNQLIEVQSPSKKAGMQHNDERILISDPKFPGCIIVILIVLIGQAPELRVITVEHASDNKWLKNPNDNPWLTRK